MKLHNPGSEIFIPDDVQQRTALERTSALAVGAHQDDIEIFAYHGIASAFGRDDQWFAAVVVTNGSGSPRDQLYARFTDAEMCAIRRREQKKAAVIGEYSFAAFLDYDSSSVKNPEVTTTVTDLKKLIDATRPRVIYTHNPADKHDTHVAVTLRLVQALRELPEECRPEQFYGCEVWRDLDWLLDEDKLALDVSAHANIAQALVAVHDSQICGGKRYDLATAGRRRANATFHASHATDTAEGLTFAMDLMPLLTQPELAPAAYVKRLIDRFADDTLNRLKKSGG
jgi:LmbE family N-acetylglucosaminyl deacetylase